MFRSRISIPRRMRSLGLEVLSSSFRSSSMAIHCPMKHKPIIKSRHDYNGEHCTLDNLVPMHTHGGTYRLIYFLQVVFDQLDWTPHEHAVR